MTSSANQRKRADLASAAGAGLLGAGLALVFDSLLAPYMVPLLILGIVTHGWGMHRKHQLETRADVPEPAWSGWLYWSCWLALLALALWIVVAAL